MHLHKILLIGLILFTPFLQAEYRWKPIESFELPYSAMLTAQVDNSVWISGRTASFWHVADNGKLLPSFNPGDKWPIFTERSLLFT